MTEKWSLLKDVAAFWKCPFIKVCTIDNHQNELVLVWQSGQRQPSHSWAEWAET